ncbi:mechanosensitive ion channel family protein [Luteibaculum oceani]|uniref:Mechanosensitive ion channel n=1 Tax=Luteibaculum oceani TaxID=1294296 RepID=A0A5C6V0Y2_9FLAO|nr:mechanosensitive ion channel domain-containing protein [Luteibaculum oceani]TXC78520.1 mechanosensitive ion channel [Luteibaculum oceani]
MKKYLDLAEHWLNNHLGLTGDNLMYTRLGIWLLVVGIVCLIIQQATKKIIQNGLAKLVARTSTNWDDIFYKRKTFSWLSNIIPALLFQALVGFIFKDFPSWHHHVYDITSAYIIFVVVATLNSVISAIKEIMEDSDNFKDKPIDSYIQLGRIILFFIGGILIISTLLGKSPFVFLGAMGALSAVLLLIFKDTILGFVASIHISVNDMVRVGDWVSMEKYGADGDVLEINLATVKVKNWDLTITTIPTYAFVSDSFKNWRGMTEGGGRRIKRSVYIDKTSIHHVSNEQIEKFKEIKLLNEFLDNRLKEIEDYNKERGIDISNGVNGRRMTNIGVFRYYVEFYLKQHPQINTDMTCMVRQLQATPNGLPLEVYAFCKDKRWVEFEAISADIFDHIFSVAKHFEIRFFQNPSGNDFKAIMNKQ